MVTDASVCSVLPFHAPGRNADPHTMMDRPRRLERLPGGDLHPLESAALSRRTPNSDIGHDQHLLPRLVQARAAEGFQIMFPIGV
jgi:hypothetical protein